LEVGEGDVDAEAFWGVWVYSDAHFEGLGAGLGAPGLAEADEEALVAGETVEDWGGFAGEGFVVGGVGDGEAAEVGDIFAEGEFSVDVDVFDDGWLRDSMVLENSSGGVDLLRSVAALGGIGRSRPNLGRAVVQKTKGLTHLLMNQALVKAVRT
jgi:hypothetical protein